MPDAADFNLNLLKTFLSLYRERNMTRAARELGLAVSTVSEHLKILREAYGDPLFLPSDKGLAPTIFAEELLPTVSDALGACARALPGEMQRGTAVVISMSDDFEIVLGRKLTDAFREELPEATPILRQTNALLAERALLSRATHFTITGGDTHSNAVARESFRLHWDCCIFDEPDPAKRGKALTLEEYAARPHVVVHYGGTFGVAEGFLRHLGHQRRVDVMTSHYAEVPQYLLGTDRIALVPVHTAKCFLERFPTLDVCEIPFHTSQDSVKLSYRNDLFEEKLFRRAAKVLRGVLSNVDWTIRTAALCLGVSESRREEKEQYGVGRAFARQDRTSRYVESPVRRIERGPLQLNSGVETAD